MAPGARISVDPPPHLLKEAAKLSAISLASGDVFVANHSERERIRTSSDADAVDMNSFGLILACQQTKTPVLIWKIVSDSADASAGEDFKTFVKSYNGEGGRMVRELLLGLPSSPLSPESYENLRELMQ